jgi:hypothetical protein
MYLNLGQDTVVPQSSIIGIFDLDNTTSSHITKNFLNNSQREKRLVNLCDGLPKSFAVCVENGETVVYLSQFASSTLIKRCESFEANAL